MDRKFGKGIVIVFFSNIFNLFFSLATNFLLPKYLSVESYAQIKTFQLYISYAGLLHLGYVDSIYLKYGGKNLDRQLDKEFYSDISTLRIFQILITMGACIISLINNDGILLLFALSIVPINMNGYFKFLYQATGDFKLYARIINMTTVLTFFSNMILMFGFESDYYIIYIVGYVLIYYIVWLILETGFKSNHRMVKGKVFSFEVLISNVRRGILLTIGNLASNFLTSMDRWFIKILMNVVAFAQYSFAVSVESFLNVAITPITTTLYNYFSREGDIKKQRNVFEYVVVFATIIPGSAFLVKIILERFLQEYINSVIVIFLLFGSQMFYVVIKSIFVNLYKVQRKQQTYFFKLVCVLCVGFIFNVLLYRINPVKESFAVGTLLSAIVWFIITLYDFQYLNISKKVYLYLFMELLIFLGCGFFMNAIVGMIIYIILTCIGVFLFMPSTVSIFIQVIKNIYYKLNS